MQPAFAIAVNDRLPIRLAAIDDNTIGSAAPPQSFAKKAFGSQQIAMFAEEEFDRVTEAIDGVL
ncbi:hypothetical protein M2281_002244 [Mesorhizobium soli]|nr:hypothetical protein [Mesorhizobium soli]